MSGFKAAAVPALAVLFAAAGWTADRPAIRQDLSRYMDRITKRGFSGAILVAKDGNVVLSKGYGPSVLAVAESQPKRSSTWLRSPNNSLPRRS